MTTIYYVDYEGAAGTGDGSSFANRAGKFEDLGTGNAYLSDGDHEVRVKKSPKKDLGSGSIKRRGGWYRNGYDGMNITNSNNYWVFGTSAGQTGFQYNNHMLNTGDWIEIWGNKWYFTDAAYGDGSSNQVMGNLVGLNGLWKVTCPDNNWIYLDDYVGHMASTTSDSWSTRKINTNTNGKAFDVTGSTVEFPSNNPLPLKKVCSNGMGNRVKWTAATNVTTYDPWGQYENWSTGTWCGASGSCDALNVDNSVAAGTKCAHFQLPSTLDLSDYQGITYELSWNSGTNEIWTGASSTIESSFSLRLCSDTAGATAVHTIPIDTRYVNSTQGRGHVEWEVSSGNLSSSIQSVAIYKETSVNAGAQFGIANVCAYKTGADRLNHNYKIGLNTTDDPWWYTIKSFDLDRNAIRLNTSYRYYGSQADEYGYYGGNLSCKWSADKTNVNIYSLKSYHPTRPWNGHDGTNGFYHAQNQSSWNEEQILSFRKFGNGQSASTLKKISGGWDDTNMSTQGSTDLTWFDFRHGNSSYGGVNADSASTMAKWQHVDRLGFSLSRANFGGKEGKYSNMHVDNGYNFNCGGGPMYGIGFKQITFIQSPSTVISSEGTERTEARKDDNYITYWGFDGQDTMYMGSTKGHWAYWDIEGIYQLRINGNSNGTHNGDDTTLHLLKSGMNGKTGEQIRMEYVKGLVIKDWQGYYNYMQIQNDSEVTIEDMTFQKGIDNGGGFHGNYSAASYSINWNSPNIKLLGGTTDKRIYFYKSAKVSGFTNTDSSDHYIANESTELFLANINGVAGAGKYQRQGWQVEPETTIRHTNSGTAWKLTRTNSSYKAIFPLAKVAVAGSGTVTVKLWVYRTVSGTDTYGLLRIPGDSTLGISKVEMNGTNGAANQWFELTCSVTPTSAGIMNVEVELVDSGSSGVLYFDDMTITQT